MKQIFFKAVVIFALSAAVGVAYNSTLKKPLSLIAKERVLQRADIRNNQTGHPAQTGHGAQEELAGTELLSITLEDAWTLFSDNRAVFVDTRTEYAFREGHITRAINIPYEHWENYIHQLTVPPGTPIIAYCDGTDCKSSIYLADVLVDLGFSPVYVFFGGWNEWRKAGCDTEAEMKKKE